MADEWVDLIWISISLIIGAVLLSMVFFFNGVGHDLTSAVYQEEADARAMQLTRVTMPYDNASNLNGSEVLAAMMDLADRNIFTYVKIGSTWHTCGPIGTTADEANSQLLRTDNATLGSIATATNFLTPQTQDVSGLYQKFDSLVVGKTMSQLKFKSKLAYEVTTETTDRVLGVIFEQTT